MKYFVAQSAPPPQPAGGGWRVAGGPTRHPLPAMSMAANLNRSAPMSKWGTLMVLSLALAIVIIDSTLLNVSLSTLVRELNTNLQSLQWVISAYALMLAALTVTGGRMGDLFGRKRMFQLGAIIFAAGSFVASIRHNVPVLLIGDSN